MAAVFSLHVLCCERGSPASATRLSLTEHKIAELATTCKAHPRSKKKKKNCQGGERRDHLVYEFDHTWAVMFEGGARSPRQKGQANSLCLQVFLCGRKGSPLRRVQRSGVALGAPPFRLSIKAVFARIFLGVRSALEVILLVIGKAPLNAMCGSLAIVIAIHVLAGDQVARLL